MTYAEQLKHPLWQKKRLEILQRDKFECRDCGDKETTLHVHHGVYLKSKMLWEVPDETLTTLCESCHEHWGLLRADLYYSIATQRPYGKEPNA